MSFRSASPAGQTLRTMTVELWSVWLPYVLAAVLPIGLGCLSAATRSRRPATGNGGGPATGAPASPPAFLVPGISLAVLGWIAVSLTDAASQGDALAEFDRPVWQWMVQHRNGFRTVVAKIVPEIMSTVCMTVVAAVMIGWLLWRRRGGAALVAAVGIGAAALVLFAKRLVGRTRPPTEFRLTTETSVSFPSGHAAASTAILGALLLLIRERHWGPRWLRIVLPPAIGLCWLSIGVSRLYLGVHWWTDVLAGWTSGAAWLIICVTVHTLYRSWQNHRTADARAGTAVQTTDPDTPKGRA